MTKRKTKPEIMWMIKGNFGFYSLGNSRSRRGAINNHLSAYDYDYTWQERRKLGDRAVRVQIKEVN